MSHSAAKSRARRAASKKKAASSKSSSSSSKSSSSNKTPTVNYNYDPKKESASQYNARIAKERAAVNAASSSKTNDSSKTNGSTSKTAPTINYTYDPKKESAAQYNARIEKERQAVRDFNAKGPAVEEEQKKEEEKGKYVKADDTELRNSAEFKVLGKDDQEAVLAVFNAIASNDAAQANRLVQGFKAATKMNDPFFKEQLRLAIDAIERGYVEIDREAEYKEMQIANRLKDLKQDYAAKKDYLTLEQASTLRGIERQYEVDLEDTRQSLAAAGFTSSSRRVKKEELLSEATGDLRESTNRKFSFEQDSEDRLLSRSERDTQKELARLGEITKSGKLDFLRKAEKEVGSKNLRNFSGYKPLGNVYGDLERENLQNTLTAATSFVF